MAVPHFDIIMQKLLQNQNHTLWNISKTSMQKCAAPNFHFSASQYLTGIDFQKPQSQVTLVIYSRINLYNKFS
jgi:hypothetical protein